MYLSILHILIHLVCEQRRFVVLLTGMMVLTACRPISPATSIASAVPNKTETPIEITGPPTGVLFLPDQRVQRLVVTTDFVYWVGLPNERSLYRAPLHTAVQPHEIELVAESRYPAGVLAQLPMIHNNGWLTFFDSASPTISNVWALRRINLVTHEERSLVESIGDQLLYGFAVNGQRAAWSIAEQSSNHACQDEAVLVLADLTTGQQTELDSACFQSERSWGTVALHDDALIANLLQNDGEDAPWGRIVRFDLAAAPPLTYTVISDLPDSQPTNLFPQIVGDWLIWNRGQDHFGEPVLLDLRTQQPVPLPIAEAAGSCQYLQVTGRWIAGHDCAAPSRILLYDPEQHQVIQLQTNSNDYGPVIASASDVVAIAQTVEPDKANLTSVIAFYNLNTAQPVSQAINKFLWQTDGVYGYRMLRPAGWTASNLGTARGYFPANTAEQTTPLLLTAVNLKALAAIAANTNKQVVPFFLFQQNPEILPWTAAMETQWQKADLSYTRLASINGGLLYAFVFRDTGFITLAAYIVRDNQPLLLQLESRDASTTLEQLRERGILADFVTMAESVTGIEHNATKVIPPLPATLVVPHLESTSTPSEIGQNIPSLTDIEAAQILFAKRSLPLGELETTFRQQLADGYFQDYTRQDLDVNGDGQLEILISGHISQWYLYFAILGYTDQGWQEWLYTTSDTKYCGDVRTSVTAEQLVVDFLTCSGGTGVFDVAWEQRWVRCGPHGCVVVWSAPLLRTERVVVWQTVRTYETATVERPNPTTIRLTTQRFGVTTYPMPDAADERSGTAQRHVGPTTVDRYQWDGQHYVWQSREEQTPGITIRDEFAFMAQETYDLVFQELSKAFVGPDGQQDGEGLVRAIADFWHLPTTDAASGGEAPYQQLAAAAHTGTPQTLGEWVAGLVSGVEPFTCHLSLYRNTDHQLTSVARQAVPCTRTFSYLAWADITGDGQMELLLRTIPSADETATDGETQAGMQRLHIYAVGNKLTELAVVDGYVNSADGTAIRWQPSTKGGAITEIWAGLPLAPLNDPTPWPDRTRRYQIYRWDTSQQKLVASEVEHETDK